MKYYVRLGEAPPQAITKLEIYQLVQGGRAARSTPACLVGASQWSTLGDLTPDLFQPGAPPPAVVDDDGNAVVDIMGKAGHFLAEHSGEMAGLARLFARRILVSNFTVEHASQDERKRLEAASIPVRSPMAQNYAAWRRAMLWFSGLGLAIAAVIQMISSFNEIFGNYVPFIMRVMSFGIVALQVGAAALILMGAVQWAQISRSRRLARWGWICGFFGPLILFILPMKQLATDKEWIVYAAAQQSPEQAAQAAQLTDAQIRQMMQSPEFAMMGLTMAVVFAAAALILLVPRVFGLFPGILRACMTLRTLVPEAPLPGYVAAVITPLYAILLLVIMGLAAQIGSMPLFCGLVALLCSPLLLLKNLRGLAKPMSSDEMNAQLKPLRMKMGIASVIGIIFILAMLGEHWDKLQLKWHSVTSVLGQLVGNIFVLTVVSADFLLSLMRFSFDQDKALAGTPLFASMEQRYADLSQVKFTQFSEDAPAPPPPPAPPAAPLPVV